MRDITEEREAQEKLVLEKQSIRFHYQQPARDILLVQQGRQILSVE